MKIKNGRISHINFCNLKEKSEKLSVLVRIFKMTLPNLRNRLISSDKQVHKQSAPDDFQILHTRHE